MVKVEFDFLAKKCNLLGDFLRRRLSPWIARAFQERPEDYRYVKEAENKYEDWMKQELGITLETPALWKSLFLYAILICGFGVMVYVFLARP